MGNVVEFQPRPRIGAPAVVAEAAVIAHDFEDSDVDLITALDVAIRDLRDIAGLCERPEAREQAQACLAMLQKAYACAASPY